MRVSLQDVVARHPAARAGAAPALGTVSLSVAAGEHVAVIGPSGAGKTTLLQVIACALRPDAGKVLLDDADPWALPAAALRRVRSQLFLAPQVPPLPPRQRVVTSVLAGALPRMGLAGSIRSLIRPTELEPARAALARFGLADKLFERVDRLSGGERQRVGLARALIAQARLLLVDEPLSALDPSRAGQAMDALAQATSETGATLVASLHDVPIALRTFPRIVGMRNGAIAFDLPAPAVTQEILASLYAHAPGEPGPAGRDPGPPEAVQEKPAPVVLMCR